MSDKTGTLTVTEIDQYYNDVQKTYEWNGHQPDRDKAREAFNRAAARGLAIVHDSPGKATQVRSFDEVEQIEKERGYVQVQVTPGLRGG